MKLILNMLKNILKGIGYFLLIILCYELVIFCMAPVYDFPAPLPFSGNMIYNPYQGMDSTHWRKANFHFHTRVWGGLTSGRSNSNDEFFNTYKALGYDAPQISNYQSIDASFKDSSFYVPVYEHGFGVRKKHQILIGAHRVLWLDYSLFQNLSHKQYMLNLLRPDNEIVAIAHPDWEGGYTTGEMRMLTNYDLVEALDRNWRSVPHWDAALSAGKAVYILADDDAHDIANPYEIQRICTYINSAENKGTELVKALKAGKAFGAEIFMADKETFAQKIQNSKSIPQVNSVNVTADTLWVSVTGKPLKITFIGQGGELKKIVRLTNKAWYKFKPEDTYIRTEIVFLKYYLFPGVGRGSIFYLNPVFRFNGSLPSNQLQATINQPCTWALRIVGFGSLIAIFSAILYFRRKRRIKQQ